MPDGNSCAVRRLIMPLLMTIFTFEAVINGERSFSDVHPQGHGMLVPAGLFMLIQHDIKRINAGVPYGWLKACFKTSVDMCRRLTGSAVIPPS